MVKDLGILIDNRLNFDEHVAEKVHKAYSMLEVIKRNFSHMKKETFLLLYKSMVRSHLKNAGSVWSPHKISSMEELEKVQKRATKMISACKDKSYTDRLKLLKLPTLSTDATEAI